MNHLVTNCPFFYSEFKQTFCSSLSRAAQEPENAHSHLLSMVLGNTETIPITQGQLALGTWQVGLAPGGCS
jgi:hypothetical protein